MAGDAESGAPPERTAGTLARGRRYKRYHAKDEGQTERGWGEGGGLGSSTCHSKLYQSEVSQRNIDKNSSRTAVPWSHWYLGLAQFETGGDTQVLVFVSVCQGSMLGTPF